MTVELYYFQPLGTNSGRVFQALLEKGVEFTEREISGRDFEHLKPAYLEVNPKGQVPTLTFPDPSLMPQAPLDRWAARAWQKYVDDYLAAAASDVAWTALGAPALKARRWNSVDEAVVRIPMQERRDRWRAAISGLPAEALDKARERIRLTVAKTESDLADRDWLAPGGFSLADIAVYPYLNYLPRIAPELVETAPRTLAWLKRMSDRPGVKAAEAMGRTGDAYGIAAPGPEPIRWG